MSVAVLYDLSPIKLNTTVLAIDDLQFTPDVIANPYKHSGNEFSSIMAVAGGNPAVKFKTPFAEAYALIGLKVLKLTAFEVYLAKFVDAIRQSGAVHRKYSLNTSQLGMAYITGASVSQDGILMAEVTVVLLSATDGVAHPLVASDTGTLPTLASEPVLYTSGPTSINSTVIGGTTGARLDLAPRIRVQRTDGDLYPRICAYLGADPSIMVDHADPATMWSTVNPLTNGVAATSLIQYFRRYDPSTQQVALASGISLTIGSGRAIPDTLSARVGDPATAPLRLIGLSATNTHPLVVATGVTVPSP